MEGVGDNFTPDDSRKKNSNIQIKWKILKNGPGYSYTFVLCFWILQTSKSRKLQRNLWFAPNKLCDQGRHVAMQSWTTITDQEKILALLASWSFHRKPTAKRSNNSIEKVLYITKKQALKAG